MDGCEAIDLIIKVGDDRGVIGILTGNKEGDEANLSISGPYDLIEKLNELLFGND